MFSQNLIEELAHDVIFERDLFDDPWQCEVKQVFDCLISTCEFHIDSDGDVFTISPADECERIFVWSSEFNNLICFLGRVMGMELGSFQVCFINRMLDFHVHAVSEPEDSSEPCIYSTGVVSL